MKSFAFVFAVYFFSVVNVFAGDAPKKVNRITEGGYTYETVSGDPLNARIYTLKNGLKVYLTVYTNKPRIQTYIAVRAGSKNDPANTTGLAHYLEHMVFKGTSKIGSADWDKEKPFLDRIESLFEIYRSTKDTSQRRKIYHQIDSLSGVASKYAIANEYTKLLTSIGAEGTNAYTWVDQTVYVNDIPSNQLEKWVKIESERFGELVPRLFHTELEAVYEEKNRSLDNDSWKIWEGLFLSLFPDHPYGYQTTIGTVEHLKNPSIKAIREYFNTYYVPNNMAICLSGDLDPLTTIRWIDKYFGKMKAKPIPEFSSVKMKELDSPKVSTIMGPESESVSIAFRTSGYASSDSKMLEIISKLLKNGQAGLFDINLNQSQKVLGSMAFPVRLNDYSCLILNAEAKEGQSLDEVKDLVLNQLELLKNGAFEDWILDAIITEKKVSEMKKYESNEARADAFVTAYIAGIPWQEAVGDMAFLSKIKKSDVVRFAKKFFGNGYALIYKRTGVDSTIQMVTKPTISPVELNRDGQSSFYTGIQSMVTKPVAPVFLDYDKGIEKIKLKNGIPVHLVKNKENGLFEIHFVSPMGTNDNPKLALAMKYLDYLGTKKFSSEKLKQEFYKLGSTYSLTVSEDKVQISLMGLDENMLASIRLLEELFSSPQPNENALKELYSDILKVREDEKKNKEIILNKALVNYAKYGPSSPFTNILSKEELLKTSSDELLQLVSSLFSFNHKILYYGPKSGDQLSQLLNEEHLTPMEIKPAPKGKKFIELPMDQPTVYWTNFDMVQTEMISLSKSVPYSTAINPQATLYNEYFGGSMNSIVFTELRESKALAYAVYSDYIFTKDKDQSNFVLSYIGTQSDKQSEALDGMNTILKDLPVSSNLFETSKKSVLNRMENERIVKSDILFNYENALKLGLTADPRKDIYEKVAKLNFS
ncbi:MAG: insulinase family protein, partial [Cytophagales bacterium]|nr:insulinase family protein [Cytophagales bacterium]